MVIIEIKQHLVQVPVESFTCFVQTHGFIQEQNKSL